MTIFVSRVHYPVIVRRLVGQTTDSETAAELARFTEELAEDLARGRKVLNLFDLSEGGALTPKQRKMHGKWLSEQSDAIRQVSVGTGFLVTSYAMRCVLTAIFWLAPSPEERIVAADGATLIRWAEGRLRANHMVIPPSLESIFQRKAA